MKLKKRKSPCAQCVSMPAKVSKKLVGMIIRSRKSIIKDGVITVSFAFFDFDLRIFLPMSIWVKKHAQHHPFALFITHQLSIVNNKQDKKARIIYTWQVIVYDTIFVKVCVLEDVSYGTCFLLQTFWKKHCRSTCFFLF